MISLREVQRAMRRCLLDDTGEAGEADDAALDLIVPDGLAPAQRLAIHRHTIGSGIVRALRLSCPAVHRLVGEAFFEAAALAFSRTHMPRSGNLDDYGAEFADFLADFEPAATLAYLPDVARLEWAVKVALQAPRLDALPAQRLAEIMPADRQAVCFVAHPSCCALRSRYPVDRIWRAVIDQDESAIAAIDPDEGPVWLLVQRLPEGLSVARMAEGPWRFVRSLCEGRPLGEACGRTPGFDPSTLLAESILLGRFVDFHVDREAAGRRSIPQGEVR